jgi:hypothetical protein
VFAFAGHLQADKLRAAQARLAAAKAAHAGARHEVHSRGSLNSRLVEILPPRPPAAPPASSEGDR